MNRYKVIKTVVIEEVYEVEVREGTREQEMAWVSEKLEKVEYPNSSQVTHTAFSAPQYMWTDQDVCERAARYKSDGKDFWFAWDLLHDCNNPRAYDITRAVYNSQEQG